MVAGKRLALAGACAVLAVSGCDILSTALPQGYANDLVSYSDPRWEARTRIADTGFFGLAVENSGPSPRIFVISRSAVTEYDEELNPVHRYLPENVLFLEAFTDGRGPEKWAAQVMSTSPPVVRLYGAWSGVALYLFDSGETVLGKRFHSGEKLFSIMENTPNFDQTQEDFIYNGVDTLSWNSGSNNTIVNPVAYSYDSLSDQVNVLCELSSVPDGFGRREHTTQVRPLQRLGGTAGVSSVSLVTPAIEERMTFDRLTTRGSRAIVTFWNGGKEFSEYESLSFLYDMLGSGQPLASFRAKAGVIESTTDSIYVLASDREGVAWLHRLRWLP